MKKEMKKGERMAESIRGEKRDNEEKSGIESISAACH